MYFAIKILGYWLLTFVVLVFPYALGVSGLHAEVNFYVLGREANLFVVARDPMACAGVEYLGHAAGSIPCAPARAGRYLVVVVQQ